MTAYQRMLFLIIATAWFFDSIDLVWCLAIGWCFVAPKTAWGKARRGSIAAALCDRGATRPQAVFGATLRAAVLFASRFVARSSQTAEGYARRSRLAGNENYLRRNTSQLRDNTLELGSFEVGGGLQMRPREMPRSRKRARRMVLFINRSSQIRMTSDEIRRNNEILMTKRATA